MAERRLLGLQRVLTTNGLFATAYGNVGSSIYYALGLVASYALGLTPVVFVIAGAIFFVTAATYAEATSMYPEAGGSSSFARQAFDELVAFVAAWGQMLNYTITIAISAYFVPSYLAGIAGPLEPLGTGAAGVLVAIGVVALLAVLNVVGTKESAGVNVLLAVVDFLTQVLLVGVGVVLLLDPGQLVENVRLGVAPTWSDFLIAIPIAMVAYTGIETISNMAEEARDETRTIPAAIRRVVVAVLAVYAVLPVVALSALPVQRQPDGSYATLLGVPEEEGGYAGDPVLGVVEQLDLGVLQGPAEVYVALLAATILFLAANAGMIGVSRLVYSMGVHRQLPDRLRALHPRFGTPWVGILVFAGVACLAILPGRADFLGSVYAFGAMLSFSIAHLAVIALRRTAPDVPRPYRGPGRVPWRGVDYPLFAILGLLGTGTAFVVVTVLDVRVAIAGAGWMAVGLVVYPLYRRRQGLDLRTTHRVAAPQQVVDHEAEYESVLVVMEAGAYSPGALATAGTVAARRRRGTYVLVTVVVPAAEPLDAPLPDLEHAAEATIEQARLQAGARVQGRVVRVRPGQAGRLVVDEARAIRARAVVAALPARRAAGASRLGRSLETVIAERPCRVIVVAEPDPAAAPHAAAPGGTR